MEKLRIRKTKYKQQIPSKDTIKRVKRQPQKGQIFANHVSDRGKYPEYRKNYNSTTERQILLLKNLLPGSLRLLAVFISRWL